ncbi:MAG: hypothetical protein AB7G35_10170 [Hyphomicrobiaceae bacterium]
MSAKRKPVVREERVPPTLETVLKRKSLLMADMPKDLAAAAELIEQGYAAIVGRPVDMTENDELAARYFRAWEAEMRRRQYPVAPVLSVIVDGNDPYDIDQRHWQVPRWCAQLVLASLSLFVETRRGLTPVLIYK